MNACVSMIYESAEAPNRVYTEFFKVFSYLSKIGPEIVNYLFEKRIIARFMDFFYDMQPFKD